MTNPDQTRPLTDFQRNAKAYMTRLRKSGRPEVLTINGKPAVVIQDAIAYQRQMAVAMRAAEIEAVLEGIAQLEAGLGIPFEEADRQLRTRFAQRRRATKMRRKSA